MSMITKHPILPENSAPLAEVKTKVKTKVKAAGLRFVTDRQPGSRHEADTEGFRSPSPKGEEVTDEHTPTALPHIRERVEADLAWPGPPSAASAMFIPPSLRPTSTARCWKRSSRKPNRSLLTSFTH